MIRRIFKFLFIFSFIGAILGGGIALFVGTYFYFRLTRDLPKIEKLSDYNPPAVTTVLADDGTVIGEIFSERRYPVRLGDIPPLVKNAFLAAEDANFYSHPGVDLVSVARAAWVNLNRQAGKQGASTITQQVVKSLLLTRERTYERKIKEAILSYRLEKALTKDGIFEIYLNEIFLGNHTYGVKAAARGHFGKELNELTIGEAAFLAGLPQRPSGLVHPKNRRLAIRRRKYVLDQMLKNNMITPEQREQALQEPLEIRPADLNTIYHAPYYYSHALVVGEEILKSINRNYSLRSPGGFQITTAVDLNATEIGERALRRALLEVDKRRGWRGPLQERENTASGQERPEPSVIRLGEVVPAKVLTTAGGVVEVAARGFKGTVDLKRATWAKRLLGKNDETSAVEPSKVVKAGMFIEVSLNPEKHDGALTDPSQPASFDLNQSPEIEGAFVVLNPHTGAVKVILGGYDYERNEFNRATQGNLQPGSSFKPFIYLAALEYLNYTPSTIVPDSPISLVAGNGQLWSPGNFDGKYLGPITLRTALARSRNVVSVHLLNRLGVDRGIETARKLGISTPIEQNMSIALGTPEVHPIEMVRAYGAFAANGWLADSLVVTSIKDRYGKVIYEQRPQQKQVVDENTAFLMANMMKGVVERGTATVLKKLGKPIGGKTGTTNDHMDTWFIGFTPEWAFGTWVGFDRKRSIGKLETGGKTAAPVILYFLEEFLADSPAIDFDIPDGVIPVPVDLGSGRSVSAGSAGAFIEYFKSGTEPAENEGGIEEGGEAPQDYLSGDEF